MLRKRTLILAAAAGAAAAGTAVADTKSWHGAACHAPTGGTVTRSGAGLTASGTVTVYCPLIRDKNNSASGVNAVHVELFNAGAGAVSCTFSSQKEDQSSTATAAATVYSSRTLSSAITSVGNVDVKTFATGTVNGNEGSYLLECDLADGDVLYHVYLNEPNSTE